MFRRIFWSAFAPLATLAVLILPATEAGIAQAQEANWLPSAASPPLWTFSALSTSKPASDNCYQTAWVSDRPGGAGMMVSDCVDWVSNRGPAGANGSTGAAGPQGIQGATGSTGPAGSSGATGSTGSAGTNGTNGTNGATGPAGFSTVTPSIPSRACNTTFTPSATNAVFVSYSVTNVVTNPLLAGSSVATVSLVSDTSATPTTERARASATSAVGLTVSLQLTQTQVTNLNYIVPAGHNVRLNCSTSGTASNSITVQAEEVLG